MAPGFDSSTASLVGALSDGPKSGGFFSLSSAVNAGGGFLPAVALLGRDTGAPLGGGAGMRGVVAGRRKDGSCGVFRRGVELGPLGFSPRVFPRGTPLECREGVPLVFSRGGAATPGGGAPER